MLAVLCPGQGAQTPGMLEPWLELPPVAAHLAALSEATNVDLVAHGTTSQADTIRDTAIAQPLLVASALVTARALLGDAVPATAVIAGHSVGEFGGEPADVAAALAALGLTAANVNGGGQVVAAGSKAAIAGLVSNPPERARVIELQVAGAFHTHYMAPAVDALAAAASGISPNDPTAILLSNADGARVASGREALAGLVRQVANPVRWDLCMERMMDLGVTGIIEVAPGGVLTGLAKRVMKGVPAVALKTPDDLAAARELMEEHA